jgi:Cd2+/Zn2+-exporting ATPase
MDRARQAIRAIMQLAPREATVRRDDRDVTVAVDDVRPGETIVVKPGDRIPLDGVVLGGASSVDQAPITGESLPVFKERGSKIFAGTINKDGALQIQVSRAARETTLAKIAQLVQEAQAQKSPAQRFSERVARYLVPGVLGAVILVLTISPLLGLSLREAFYRAMMLLVAASPCALAIATPAAVLSAVGRAAMGGVLVKGGSALEDAGGVRAVALDKTGTLTTGEPAVTDVLPHGDATQDAVLQNAAAVERRSGHPLGRAIVQAAEDRGLRLSEAHDVRAVVGKGVTGSVDGANVAVGSVELFGELGLPVPAVVRDTLGSFQRAGKTSVIVAVAEQIQGVIALADTPRPTARGALDRLRQIGVRRFVMLTGDNARVAQAIAAALGVDEVRAGLLPHEKVDAVKALVARDGKVAMVGDGVNDAPALAAATVGIAVGAGGTDAALETADIALMADDLEKLSYAIGLGRATRAVTRQNVAIALGVIALLVLTTVVGAITLPAAVVLHEGSTLLVVANGLRLLTYTGPGGPPA